MKYPNDLRVIIDVTKAPYYADNTGTYDCTEILQQIYDDIILNDVKLVRETFDKLSGASQDKNTYLY